MKKPTEQTLPDMHVLNSEKGFILMAALIACAILMALGILIWVSSNGELKTSASTLGEKKALAAVESGYHILTQAFDPMATNYGITLNTWANIDTTYAPNQQYKITSVALSSFPALPPPGYSIESSQGWGVARFDVTVFGRDTAYDTEQEMDVGIGYGPVSLSLVYR